MILLSIVAAAVIYLLILARLWRRVGKQEVARDDTDLLCAKRDIVLALHTPEDEEVERWPDDDFQPPVDEECTIIIRVCAECGYEHDGDHTVYRRWPCPTVVALSEEQRS